MKQCQVIDRLQLTSVDIRNLIFERIFFHLFKKNMENSKRNRRREMGDGPLFSPLLMGALSREYLLPTHPANFTKNRTGRFQLSSFGPTQDFS